MHRVVIFSNPVISNGIELYGRLYRGATEGEILSVARFDYKTLLIRELWEGELGETFRKNEGWTLTHSKDDSTSWYSYDESKYTFCLGFDPIPDQFVQGCPQPCESLALVNVWIPIRMADTDIDDYIVNEVLYESVIGANPNDIQWVSLEPEYDDLPF